ncbi:Gag protein [Phytophthora palmivora]|uniref:Gag protein n=1 Tax=Phytophthora palmivora TaxID=4796 RepID=A0A2P4X4A2_9STRA|nr:Gag protein [Phytophthora palmivora]
MDRGEFPYLTDAQFESVRKMAAATPAEQIERIEAFDTYKRGLIAHVQGLQAPVAELKPAQPKPLRLKVNSYEGKEGGNLHFWVREVELAGGRAKTWAYTREATTPGCFTTWAQLCQQLRAAFLPANYEYRQRSRFLACKQGKRELHEHIQEMRVLASSLVGNPLPERIKVTVFMDGLKVGPSRTQLFRVHANTMEEAIQMALQEGYSHRQARTPTSVWQGHNASSGAVQGAPAAGASTGLVPMELGTALFRVHANTMEEAIQMALQEGYSHRQARTPTSVWQGHNASSDAVQGAPAAGASTGLVPMELGTAVQSSIRCYGCGKLGHMQRACPAGGQRKFPSKPRGSRGPWQKPRPKSQGNWCHQ